MPHFRVNVSITQKGAVFDAARTKASAERMIVDINDEIAQTGVNMVRATLRQVLQNPTGFYESRIAVDRRQTYRGIWDQLVVYGPWLEGTGTRNQVSRFKGYRTFRKIKQAIDQIKGEIAQPIVDQFVNEMNR